MKGATRLRLALRSALRRRYGYSALRRLRTGVQRAVAIDRQLSVGPARYVSQLDEIAAAYWRGLQRLRRRWPNLDLDDPRAQP